MLGPQTSLKTFKKIEVIPCICSDHNTMKLDVNHQKKSGKTTNTGRLNNMILNNEWVDLGLKRRNEKVHGNK